MTSFWLIKYAFVGFLPDFWYAMKEWRIKALFLNINVGLGAAAVIITLINVLGLNIMTVALALYIALVAIDVIEHVFYAVEMESTSPYYEGEW